MPQWLKINHYPNYIIFQSCLSVGLMSTILFSWALHRILINWTGLLELHVLLFFFFVTGNMNFSSHILYTVHWELQLTFLWFVFLRAEKKFESWHISVYVNIPWLNHSLQVIHLTLVLNIVFLLFLFLQISDFLKGWWVFFLSDYCAIIT